MSLGRLCIVGGNVLWEVLCWWSACLHDGISHTMFRICLTGVHVS